MFAVSLATLGMARKSASSRRMVPSRALRQASTRDRSVESWIARELGSEGAGELRAPREFSVRIAAAIE
jgi:hypothetical protein